MDASVSPRHQLYHPIWPEIWTVKVEVSSFVYLLLIGSLDKSMHACMIVILSLSFRSADFFKYWTKNILVALFIGTVGMQLIFTLTCSRILPFFKEILFGSIIISGLLFNGTLALLFELIMECVYPIGEATAVGVGLVFGNVVILLFDVTFMLPLSDVRWMNWLCVGGIGVCVPLLLLYKSQYQRLDQDLDRD